MRKTIAALMFALVSAAAWALPTVQDVEAQVQQGHYAQAETMMREVVDAKPGSARAHYIYAEILAHNANFAKASEEAATAQRLDPKIGFTDPDKFRSFQQTLQRELNPPARARTTSVVPTYAPAPVQESRSGGIPGWVWGLGLVVLAIVLWRGFSNSRAQSMGGPGAMGGGNPYPVNGPVGGPPGYGPGGGYGPVMQQGGGGSGLLGTGLAVAGGVAGGMLIDEMLHRRSDGGGGFIGGANAADSSSFTSPDPAATELENRQVDFGNGGDSWDSGGGSFDGGGGDSGGGGGWD